MCSTYLCLCFFMSLDISPQLKLYSMHSKFAQIDRAHDLLKTHKKVEVKESMHFVEQKYKL